MAEATCPTCGRHFVKRTGQHRYCTPLCRERARAGDFSRRTRYSTGHQALRKALGERVASGQERCARCGDAILPGEPWDLDHRDDGDGYLGPSHAACNRATATAAAAASNGGTTRRASAPPGPGHWRRDADGRWVRQSRDW